MSEQYVLGEGVILDARPASFMTRILGYLLDALVYGIVLFVGILVMDNAGWLLYDYETQSVILLLVFAFVLLPTIIETLSRGRSLGKLATGVGSFGMTVAPSQRATHLSAPSLASVNSG